MEGMAAQKEQLTAELREKDRKIAELEAAGVPPSSASAYPEQ